MPENRKYSGGNMTYPARTAKTRPQPPPRFESRNPEHNNIPKKPEEKPQTAPQPQSMAVCPRYSDPLSEIFSSRENLLLLALMYILYREKADPKLLLALAYIML